MADFHDPESTASCARHPSRPNKTCTSSFATSVGPGQAYTETDPTQADASTIVRNLLDGQYSRPVRVLALNVEEGWVRDVSQVIATKVRDVARRDGRGLTGGTRGFIEAHIDPADQQQVLPLWQ
jgi:hypothetical protein